MTKTLLISLARNSSQSSRLLNSSTEVGPWEMCGGYGYAEPTNCTAGYLCVIISHWYSQCYSAPPLEGKTCISAGRPNTDVAGIGVLVVAMTQASLTMALTLWAGRGRNDRARHYIIKVLLCSSDVQTLNGIGMALSAIVHYQRANLYHLRLIYDTVSLIGISIWPSMLVNSLRGTDNRNGPRAFALSIFATLYFILTTLLGIRLRAWNKYSPGQCYESGVLTIEYLPHPVPDLIYLGITSSVLMLAMFGSAWVAVASSEWWHNGCFVVVAVETILSFVSIVVLRATKQNFLVSDETDNDFGFGQVNVMVYLLAIPFECYRSFGDWHNELHPRHSPNAYELV